jgi:hypothetical protein
MECQAGTVPVLECTHSVSVVRAIAGRSTAAGVSYGDIGMITLIIKMAEGGWIFSGLPVNSLVQDRTTLQHIMHGTG